MILFLSEDVELPSQLNTSVKDWISTIIGKHSKIEGDINYMFCSDKHILKVNRDYLQHDYYTDIITFDYCTHNVIAGDLVISLDTVKSNAVLFSSDYEYELLRVIIHGILHLIGFNDHSEEEKVRMRGLENEALKLFPTFR